MSFGHFATFLRCPVYTNPYFGGTPLKSVTAQPKLLTLISNKHKNNLDLFFQNIAKLMLSNSRLHVSYRGS